MPKTIRVTRAQVLAAQTKIILAERGYGHVTPAIIAIANAKPARRSSDAGSQSSPAEDAPI